MLRWPCTKGWESGIIADNTGAQTAMNQVHTPDQDELTVKGQQHPAATPTYTAVVCMLTSICDQEVLVDWSVDLQANS